MRKYENLKVLIFDKIEISQYTLELCLRELGFIYIYHALNLKKAIEVVESEKLDLIFCDRSICPYEVIDFVNYKSTLAKSDIPFVMMSEPSKKHELDDLIKIGVSRILYKPVNVKAVSIKLDKIFHN